jgi:hypothetical protein
MAGVRCRISWGDAIGTALHEDWEDLAAFDDRAGKRDVPIPLTARTPDARKLMRLGFESGGGIAWQHKRR